MRNLLITTIGNDNHLGEWLNGERNFDVAIVNYDKHTEDYKRINICKYYNTFSTFKYPGIVKVFAQEPDLLRYDYYWMPDEDVSLSTEEINKLFRKMDQFKIDLGQPSIEKSNVSFPSWDQFTHRGNTDIIYATFIEIMCPCFSHGALMKCLETFKKSKSGWGLDIVWPHLIGDNKNNIAIFNSIVAKHTRRTGGGMLYNALTKERILPSNERKRLMREYKIRGLNINIHADKSILY
jgi:hypothetical protein